MPVSPALSDVDFGSTSKVKCWQFESKDRSYKLRGKATARICRCKRLKLFNLTTQSAVRGLAVSSAGHQLVGQPLPTRPIETTLAPLA